MDWPCRSIVKSEHHPRGQYKLKPTFYGELARYPINDRLKVPLPFRFELDMAGEGFDPRMLECKALGTDPAHELNRPDAVRLFGEYEIATPRTQSLLDVAQNGIARFAFV